MNPFHHLLKIKQPSQLRRPKSLFHPIYKIHPRTHHWPHFQSIRNTSAVSSKSSQSNESCREPSSNMFAFDFLRATFELIQDELDKGDVVSSQRVPD
jgi:hypothetical protein